MALEEMPVSGLGGGPASTLCRCKWRSVALLPLALLLLVSFGDVLLGFAGLLRSFSAYIRGHSRTWVNLI